MSKCCLKDPKCRCTSCANERLDKAEAENTALKLERDHDKHVIAGLWLPKEQEDCMLEINRMQAVVYAAITFIDSDYILSQFGDDPFVVTVQAYAEEQAPTARRKADE